jgi:two-component system chemotaxis response regulator CheB
VLIVQHLPEYIVPAFAERLGRLTRVPVEVATDGMLVRAGTVTIAPGGRHMAAESVGSEVRLRLQNKEKVNGHRPAVDVLFGSLARVAGKDALGVLLTGMGRDGAEGLLAMHQSGARTVVQDEASSVVWGMPKAAIEVGAAQEVLSLSHLVERIAHAGMRRRPTWRPMRQPR